MVYWAHKYSKDITEAFDGKVPDTPGLQYKIAVDGRLVPLGTETMPSLLEPGVSVWIDSTGTEAEWPSAHQPDEVGG